MLNVDKILRGLMMKLLRFWYGVCSESVTSNINFDDPDNNQCCDPLLTTINDNIAPHHTTSEAHSIVQDHHLCERMLTLDICSINRPYNAQLIIISTSFH